MYICIHLSNHSDPYMLAAACTAAVGSSIGTAVGVSVSVTFVVSFSMGVLVLLFSATFQEGPKSHHTN